VAGSIGAAPDTKTRPAAFTAWLYVAGGFAALVVKTICRGTIPSSTDRRSNLGDNIAIENIA
jgi:hypothetical protein